MATDLTRTFVAAVALVAAACGAADGRDAAPATAVATTASTTTSTTTSTTMPPATLDVRLSEYAVHPPALRSGAGAVELVVTNADAAPHDLVVLATDLGADELPTTGIRVDEADPAVRVLTRTPTLRPGEAASVRTQLAPGRYVVVCTVPHHYVREAMVATLVVG